MFSISDQPFDTAPLVQQLHHPRAGAMVSFEGWVRNHHEGRDVLRLEYEAYDIMCRKESEALEKEILAKYDIMDILCVHRTGPCEIGDMAVWVGVTAEHRGPAFEACEDYMNQLKVRLPIWKKETYVDGTSDWVRCEACAAHAHDDQHSHHHAHPEHSHQH